MNGSIVHMNDAAATVAARVIVVAQQIFHPGVGTAESMPRACCPALFAPRPLQRSKRAPARRAHLNDFLCLKLSIE